MTQEQDHDQRFKLLIETFFSDFLELVVPEHAKRLQLDSVEFLTQEHYTDVPQGEHRALDIIAKVRAGSEVELVLVHIEVERVYRAEFAERFWRYFAQLYLRHGLSILPIVLFLRGGPADVTLGKWDALFLEQRILTFEYWSMGLSKSDAAKYLAKPQLLAYALAALMRFKGGSQAQHKLACMKQIATAKTDEARQFLLLDTVQTYLTLENERLAEYHLLLGAEPKKEVAAVELWWSQKLEQKGLQEGLQEGLQKGKVNAMAAALLLCLEKRGLTPTDEQKKRIEACGDFEALQAWFSLAFEISAVDELFSSSRA